MELVTSLRTLWRFRLTLIVLALLAVAVGLAMAYRFEAPATLKSRQYQVAIASAQALVDTPSSQIADLGGGVDAPAADIATLSARASLLANLMTNSPMKEEIASRAGVSPEELVAVPPPSAEPGVAPATGGSPGTTISLTDPRANILKATIPELQSGQIPIISVQTQAPDAAAAVRLANEAIAVLQSHLSTVANNDKVPSQRRVIVRQLGRAHASVESRGPGKKLAVLVAVFVFAFGCGTILAVVALVGGWRQASAFERSLEPEYGPELVPGDEERPAYREGAEPPLEPAAPDHAGWTFAERHGGAVGKQRT
jgi:hypothetical protein